jgi:diaminopimelate decarboxylase
MTALRAVLPRPELELLGVHTHIGSQIQDAAAFEVSARKLLALRAQLYAATGTLLPELDLGGGFGIAYTADDSPVDITELARALADVVDQVSDELELAVPRISIEPGRAIAGPSTVTLYEVGVVKPVTVGEGDVRVRTYVSVDGGMSDNIRPALYGAEYTARLANRSSGKVKVRSRVVGKHCESGDIVIPDIDLPADVAPGDLLAVPATGAYGRSMASNYNLVARPPVVAVKDGTARVIVRRETEDDLLATDVG